MFKELFMHLSLRSDVAARLMSDVNVCDCAQGLEVAYRFE